MSGHDPLTAPAAAIPSRTGGESRTLGDVWRSFSWRQSPRVIGAAIALAAAVRVVLGHWSWRDAVMAVGLVAVTPFVEWAIHVYLLHAPPLRIGRRVFELPSAREHVAHHRRPAVLDELLIPTYALLLFLPAMFLIVWALSFAIALVIGGDRMAWVLTGTLASFAILGAYEWTHFLIHTPYRPATRYFHAVWRNHRLHHYKNENYWFGVTSTIGDRMIGTLRDQREVPRSATARTLHAGDE